MSLLTSFISAFIVSYLGSIPPGVINLTVIDYSLNNKFKQALWFSAAVSLFELPYATAALWGASYFNNLSGFKYVTAALVVFYGLFYLKSAFPAALVGDGFDNKQKSSLRNRRNAFLRGVLVSVLNPLALPYWLVTTAALEKIGIISLHSFEMKFVYILGIGLGTFLLQASLMWLIRKKIRFQANQQKINIVIGITLLIVGILVLLK